MPTGGRLAARLLGVALASIALSPPLGRAAVPPGAISGVPIGLIAGACSKLVRDLVIHPIDTVKSRRQVVARTASGAAAGSGEGIYARLYDGIGPSLISGVPAGALYLYLGDLLRQGDLNSGLAGAAASFVFWTVRTPGEVLKTRMQVGGGAVARASVIDAVRTLCAEEGPAALYSGYAQTLARSLPFDFVRFLAFDALLHAEPTARLLGGTGAADTVCGFVASGFAALLTQPLDVAKTLAQGSRQREGDEGAVQRLLAQTTPANVLELWWGGGAERVVLASLSGGVYFGVFEATKHALEPFAR
jgi:hypothetical protein